MGEVVAHLAMSLDGFIADPDDGCDELFGFYERGEVAVKLSQGFPELHVSQTTADLLTTSVGKAGATVVGRRLYDITNGWDGHPGGEVPMVVVTHHPPADWPRGGVPVFFETSVAADGQAAAHPCGGGRAGPDRGGAGPAAGLAGALRWRGARRDIASAAGDQQPSCPSCVRTRAGVPA